MTLALATRLVVALVLLAAGAQQLCAGLYIQAKARLAQHLIARAWERTLEGERQVKPWPWADTWPVARLKVPAQGIDLYVLAGANGRAIAFGPGHVFGTPLPGDEGNSVIGGHRDTHLAFLGAVGPGTAIEAQSADGLWSHYRVTDTRIVDKGAVGLARNTGPTRLTLVTCYPFHALQAGGPLRYVVTAMAD